MIASNGVVDVEPGGYRLVFGATRGGKHIDVYVPKEDIEDKVGYARDIVKAARRLTSKVMALAETKVREALAQGKSQPWTISVRLFED